MRPLTPVEKDVVSWFVTRLEEPQRQRLLGDLDNATVDEIRDEQMTICFHIEGYARPPYRFERPLPINACVLDTDGAKLAVTLAADENGRLFELQVIRFEAGPVIGPDWTTLRVLQSGELVNLGTLKVDY
jgi:hypothetical protein